jgi:uncharacterized PurR-regulated membrane protein YhhQ (DUF165 family)
VPLPGAAIWPPKARAYGGEMPSLLARYQGPLQAAARLCLPVVLLTVLLAAAFLYSDALLLLPDAPRWVQKSDLGISDLILPLAWTVIHLTNRRHGAPYAFAQLVIGLCLLVAIVVIDGLDNMVALTPAGSARSLASFGLSFLLANFIGITLFEAMRGPHWWWPPLAGSFAVSLVFSLFFYPAAFAGEGTDWSGPALAHFALFPYYLLRPAMRPLDGMNGY